MPEITAGFCERAHTADWGLEVWAPDMPALLEQAARGMYALSGTRLQDAPRLNRLVEINARDAENLLVRFLAELLYMNEQENLAFDEFDLGVDGYKLRASLSGAPVADKQRDIKAVTYHQLTIRQTSRGLEVTLTFDV